ncbi:MAG: hypothetical protein ACRD0H_17585 [Actinomycetes bacterium]
MAQPTHEDLTADLVELHHPLGQPDLDRLTAVHPSRAGYAWS